MKNNLIFRTNCILATLCAAAGFFVSRSLGGTAYAITPKIDWCPKVFNGPMTPHDIYAEVKAINGPSYPSCSTKSNSTPGGDSLHWDQGTLACCQYTTTNVYLQLKDGSTIFGFKLNELEGAVLAYYGVSCKNGRCSY